MLVSHDYKFIYIKSRKTAGTSVQNYFSPYSKNGIRILSGTGPGHMPSSEVKELVGDEIWVNYFKFTAIRNPWDAMVSMYFWRTHKRKWWRKLLNDLTGKKKATKKEWPFGRFVKEFFVDRNFNRSIINIDEKFAIDYFIRYEHLQDDIKEVCGKLNIPFDIDLLGNYKSGHRPKVEYQQFYNDETRDLVAEAFKNEIAQVGYVF